MRAKGYRLVQMWLPDTRTPEFEAEAHRQSLLISQSESEKEFEEFMRAIWCSPSDQSQVESKNQ